MFFEHWKIGREEGRQEGKEEGGGRGSQEGREEGELAILCTDGEVRCGLYIRCSCSNNCATDFAGKSTAIPILVKYKRKVPSFTTHLPRPTLDPVE